MVEIERGGLTELEARARLQRDGFNDLPAQERRSLLQLLLEVGREPMFALLVGAAVLYGLIGEMRDALVLLAFATVSVSIAAIQRGRSERVMDALRDLTSPRALVVRDGIRKRVPGREVVRGDLLIVTEGDRVPADALLVSGTDIRVDESLLTGESVPVRKQAARSATVSRAVAGGDDLPHLFSGTLIVRGTGVAIVTATGSRTEIGRIGLSLRKIDSEPPRLQVQTRRLVVGFATVGLTFSFFVAILYGLLRGQWLQGVLGGIALAMSMLPEEFPLVLTVFMVMGAWRLSRSHVLTRRTAAIETLGAATVLCTDKTGTLTHNAMAVAHLQSESDVWRSGESPARILESRGLALLLETAVLASEPHALDPMERSLVDLAADARSLTATDMVPARTYPLRPQLLAITQAWNVPSTPAARIAAKGAPEAIARLCRLDERSTRALTARVDELARSGMRVLAVANGTHPADALPDEATQLTLQLAGLVGFADPLRPAVPAAVRECHAAGIRVVMITGDYPQTAQAIARQAGIEQDAVLTGDEMQRLAADELAARLPHTNVFARISHQQKLRLVEIFKANGDVVAMTGDGVNDAPALKAAHIGIAMGGRGTDVAREAATLVLLDDDFGSIVRAIRLGRRIYDNLRKACGYILAIHVPIAGVALLPVLFGGPLILTPMLIAFLELIIDPACSVVFEAEPEEGDIMRRSPRDPERALVSRSLALWSLSQGCAALVLVGAVFFYASAQDLPHEEIRALTFLALVGANIALIFVNRTFGASPLALLRRPHPALWWGLGIALGVLAVLFAWPAARGFLELGPLHPDDFAVCLLVVVLLLAILQAAKRVWRGALHA